MLSIVQIHRAFVFHVNSTKQGNQEYESDFQVSGRGQCDFVEFRSLTLRPLVEPCQMSAKLNWIHNPEVNK